MAINLHIYSYIFKLLVHDSYISETLHPTNVSICGSGEREQQIYSSAGYTVDVWIIMDTPDTSDTGYFLLKYEGE